MIRRTFLHITNDYLDGKITIKEFFKQIEEYEKTVKPNKAISEASDERNFKI